MFKVENADFIADKLAAELLPNQEFREVLKNAIEAVQRRMAAQGVTEGGRVEFDVDWALLNATGNWYVCCSDNGDGMNHAELTKYTTTLAVRGAGNSQSLRENQGMGLKISGPTRHKIGVLIRSRKDGDRSMVQVGWNGKEYGLIPIGSQGEVVTSVPDEYFPQFVLKEGTGTVVTFLGCKAEGENTFVPPGSANGWLFKYLHTRFLRLSENGVEVIVRVPSGAVEDWPRTLEEASLRQKGQGGKSFNYSMVRGTAPVWDRASETLGPDYRGMVSLPGDRAAGIPSARVHWWVLPGGPGTDVSSRTASGGSLAVLFDNELHDWRTSSQANPYFARLGVLFGKNRVAFVIEPEGPSITSDFARAHVLVGGIPVFESDAWHVWSDQFRAALPEKIKQTIDEEQARLEVEDPDRAKRIRDRLKDVMQLLRPRRFRVQSAGEIKAAPPKVTGPGRDPGSTKERTVGAGSRGTDVVSRGIGSVLSQVDEEEGTPANAVHWVFSLEPKWVTEAESETLSVVSGNGSGLKDRAAALVGADARSASILLLNKDFRGYQTILAAVNEWANPDGDADLSGKIVTITQEWIEQKMIEAVQGLRQLENGSTWLTMHYDAALSPVALTAAFMADRYHTLAEVKRAVGAFRRTVPARA